MTAQELAATFPSSIALPPEVAALCSWVERNGYPISGYFELREHDDETIRLWFGGTKAVGRLAQFGAGPDGSLYCLWRQDDGRTPIVHMGSEGQNNMVLAADAQDFMRLLAVGYEEIGFDDLAEPPTGEEPNRAFQEWVHETFGVTIPAVGSEVTAPAQQSHEDFQAWIDARTE